MTELSFKAYLESIGDSIVVVSDDGIVKVHVHTDDPGLAIQKALTYGSLTSMKIDNMREEHKEKLFKESEKKVGREESSGGKSAAGSKRTQAGWFYFCFNWRGNCRRVFRDLGVDYLIEGGQTMDPSTEDMLNAIEKVNADTDLHPPDTTNISILAANQARDLTEDKKIIVVPTKTVPQGITAIINYVPEKTPEENAQTMEEEISHVKTGQLTYAVRDTHIDEQVIHAGDIMGVGDHAILAVGREIDPVAEETVALMMDDESELISIYYGEDMKEEEAEALHERIAKAYPDCDVELNYGGQPIYYYIISVE